MLRVLLVDDHDVVLRGLQTIIAARPGWEVVATARESNTAFELARQFKPDVAIVDYSIGPQNGGDLTRALRALLPQIQVLIFTLHDSEHVIRDAVDAGARAFVSKSEIASTLDFALQALERGHTFLHGPAGDFLVRQFRKGALSPSHDPVLTPRQRDVLVRIAKGRSGKQIAAELGISPKTVEIHRSAIMRKFNVGGIAEIARLAIQMGLVEV